MTSSGPACVPAAHGVRVQHVPVSAPDLLRQEVERVELGRLRLHPDVLVFARRQPIRHLRVPELPEEAHLLLEVA
jgi:hypothetical protein